VALAVVGHLPADRASVLSPRVKHRSRLAWWVIDRLPRPAGTVAIVTDRPGGTLTETSAANFLAVVDGVLTTPPRDRVLDGISLRVTLELADTFGVPTGERELPPGFAPRMSEAMLTGSGFGLAGVRRIDGHDVPWPGPVFVRLREAWDRAVSAG
jgi:branched-subunit amino acid aminotransferase/4-amino-4-deoxychorismate lyase